jgi:hypothetical protein
MRQLLLLALLAATANAGVAAANGPCQSGSTPALAYSVCLLQSTSRASGCPDCGYRSASDTDQLASAGIAGPTEDAGVLAYQHQSDFAAEDGGSSSDSSLKVTDVVGGVHVGGVQASFMVFQTNNTWSFDNPWGSSSTTAKSTYAIVSTPLGSVSAGQGASESTYQGPGYAYGTSYARTGVEAGGLFLGQESANGACWFEVGVTLDTCPEALPMLPDVPQLPPPPL